MTLQTILENAEVSEERIEDWIQSYNVNIKTDGKIFKFMAKTKDDYSWVQIRSQMPQWQVIAYIALRLLNSALSEASCKRTIKRQR